MRDAPNQRLVQGNISTGHSGLFLDRDFVSYKATDVSFQSPYEKNGSAYNATPADFGTATSTYTRSRPAPNLIGGFAIGDRFLNRRLSVVLMGSFQNTYRGSNSLFFDGDVSDTLRGIVLTKSSERQFSERQTRYGIHSKVDFRLNDRNRIQWYGAFMNLTNVQIRETKGTELGIGGYDPVLGNAGLNFATRSRLTRQQIFTSTLQGIHRLTDNFGVQWSAVCSMATNAVADQTNVPLLVVRRAFVETRTTINDGSRR